MKKIALLIILITTISKIYSQEPANTKQLDTKASNLNKPEKTNLKNEVEINIDWEILGKKDDGLVLKNQNGELFFLNKEGIIQKEESKSGWKPINFKSNEDKKVKIIGTTESGMIVGKDANSKYFTDDITTGKRTYYTQTEIAAKPWFVKCLVCGRRHRLGHCRHRNKVSDFSFN